MQQEFLRTEMMLGPAAMERLWKSHVAVFGLGGVGSWAVEALARSGVGALTLVDHDEVGLTNLNRQLGALHSTLGKPKAEALAERVRDISPDCRVTPLVARYDGEHREAFFSVRYDYIVDAIDLVSCKLDLIQDRAGPGHSHPLRAGDGEQAGPWAVPHQRYLQNRGVSSGTGGAQGTAGPGHPAPPGSLVAGAPGRHGSERGGPAAWPPERTGQRSLGALCGRPDDGRRCDHDPERYETGIKTSLHWQTEANGGMFL